MNFFLAHTVVEYGTCVNGARALEHMSFEALALYF